MLNLFKSDRLAKAHKAIMANDIELLAKLLKKIDQTEINQPVSEDKPSLLESCLIEQNRKALQLMLDYGASPIGKSLTQSKHSYFQLALTQKQSHSLLKVMLDDQKAPEIQQLLIDCFQLSSEHNLMLNIAVLLENGASVDNEVLHAALKLNQKPLIHYLINTGATLPEDVEEHGHNKALIDYAKKCSEDVKIRSMFLNR